MTKLDRFYYRMTAYVPRALPTTELEFLDFKHTLIEAYDVPDRPDSWLCATGHIQQTPAHKLRRPWGHIANAAKRLRINNIAQAYKQKVQKELEDALNASVAKYAAEVAEQNQSAQEPEQAIETPIAPV